MANYDPSQIDDVFNQTLGRPATQAEHDFFKPYVQQGFITPYQIGQYAAGLPEAQTKLVAGQTQQYSDLLTKNNTNVLNQAADAANGSFAQAGRQFSTGQGNSVLQAGQQLAAGQSPMIASFYGQGAQGITANTVNQSQSAVGRAYGLNDTQAQYNHELSMYNLQKNDYNDYLNQANRLGRQGQIGSLIGAGIGAGLGSFGGVPGAQLGAGIGARAGGIFGY